MDPIDRRHAEWQHALYGDPAPTTRPGLVGPVVIFGAALALPWLPALIGAFA